MNLRRVLKALAVSTATLAQGSRDVDLSSNVSDWKQVNVTKDNNTFQLAYSMDFPEGREGLEEYASCVTNAIEKDATRFPNVTDEGVNTTQLLCNTTAFFTPKKNKPLILNTQVSSLSVDQCELLENMTWAMMYSCMKQIDQPYQDKDSTQSNPDKSKSPADGLSNMDVVGLIFGPLAFIAIVGGAVAGYILKDNGDPEPSTPTSSSRSLSHK